MNEDFSTGIQEFSATPVRPSTAPKDIEHPHFATSSQQSNNVANHMVNVKGCLEEWFHKYHPWFPILHKPSFDRTVSRDSNHLHHELVLQAVVLVTSGGSQVQEPCADSEYRWKDRQLADIILGCIKAGNIRAVQALLILSIGCYGDGEFLQAWSLVAIARRSGLPTISSSVNMLTNGRVAAHLKFSHSSEPLGPTATSPTALRRLPAFVNTIVAHEENIRAYWMIEVLDSISTIGSCTVLPPVATPGDPLLPCSDTLWDTDLPADVGDAQLRPYHYCSAFSLCIILATSELRIVHEFLRRPVVMEDFAQRDAWQSEAQQIDERLTAWRDEFVAAVFRLINAEKMDQRRAEMDAYVVLTNCVLNTAIIQLFQRRTTRPQSVEQLVDPWAFANNRCVYACENTAFKIRQMDEEELLLCNPHLIFSIFAAARFYLVHSKAVDANVPTNLHSLAFALHTCGKRWSLARKYEHVIRIAVADYRTPVSQSRVPTEFYDLTLNTFDISESLVQWADGSGADMAPPLDQQSVHGSLDFTPMVINPLA